MDRIAAAFKGARGRAALMPYLMAGFPDIETSVRVATAYADAGADLIELGVPFSDPLADGPVIHAAATAALEGGATVHTVLEAGTRIAELIPVVLMVYVNPILARGPERFAAELAAARDQRPDRPRPPARGVRAGPRRVRCARRRARSARGPDHPGRSSKRNRADCAWICLHGFGHRDHR